MNVSAGLLRFTTAGSVDHGKSTLIGRLLLDAGAVPTDRLNALQRSAEEQGRSTLDLSLLLDGLTAEREQGITIDVAYSYFASKQRKFIIADTPGHEQYTRNMVTGASTADAALILVDASRGMTSQSKRHLALSHLLGIAHLVVVISKMDLVDFAEAAFARTATEVRSFAAGIGAQQIHIVPTCAKSGDNIVHGSARMAWYLGPPLLTLLEQLPGAAVGRALPFRLPVQQVRRLVDSDGNVRRQYLGQIATGTVRRGDEILVMPSGLRTRITALTTFDGAINVAAAPKSLAVEVADDLDIGRGDVLTDATAPATRVMSFEATICWFADEPFIGKSRYLLKSGTRTVSARIDEITSLFDTATLEVKPAPQRLERNDIAQVRFSLASPLAVDLYRDNRTTGALIVIDEDTQFTVAAGMIGRGIEPMPLA
ncbi:MAG: 50S ribosome-binding GTPase [Alphaproteobacteria bacterium]|nr:50S ribosome-binding GTPase [Alphaproteobacteria bacterium]